MNKQLIKINADKRRRDMCKRILEATEAVIKAQSGADRPLEPTPALSAIKADGSIQVRTSVDHRTADAHAEETKGNGPFLPGANDVGSAPNLIPPPAMTNQTYTIHPVPQLFPGMTDKEFAELKASISRDGQLQAIVTDGNEILDGRHRFRACLELGIEPRVIQYKERGPWEGAVDSL